MGDQVIVVVDDDEDIREFVYICLTEAGHRVIPWPTAAGAHDLIRREQPAVVILDLRLEGQASGWTVLADLRQDPLTTSIPAIMYTGGDSSLQAHHAALRGLHCQILLKPFRPDDLLALITRALDSSAER